MEYLNLDELEGYREDPADLARFVKPYGKPSFLGVLVSLVGFVLLFPFGMSALPLSLMGLGLTVYGVTIWLMFTSTPISSFSGKPLVKYWNSSPLAQGGEVIYVCEDSRTFFRRCFTKRPGR